MGKVADPGSVDRARRRGEVHGRGRQPNTGRRDLDRSRRRRLRQPRPGLPGREPHAGPRPTARPAFLWPRTTGASEARTRTRAASWAASRAPQERRTRTPSRRRSPTRPERRRAKRPPPLSRSSMSNRRSRSRRRRPRPSSKTAVWSPSRRSSPTPPPWTRSLVDQLTDSIHGDLIRGPIKASCTYGGTAVTLPRSLPVGESFICTFRATVSVSETDIVSASGIDPERNRVIDAAEALVTVLVTPTPEPPPRSHPRRHHHPSRIPSRVLRMSIFLFARRRRRQCSSVQTGGDRSCTRSGARAQAPHQTRS